MPGIQCMQWGILVALLSRHSQPNADRSDRQRNSAGVWRGIVQVGHDDDENRYNFLHSAMGSSIFLGRPKPLFDDYFHNEMAVNTQFRIGGMILSFSNE